MYPTHMQHGYTHTHARTCTHTHAHTHTHTTYGTALRQRRTRCSLHARTRLEPSSLQIESRSTLSAQLHPMAQLAVVA